MSLAEPPVRLQPVTVVAAAKINLALHVVGRRSDGYHLLSSLVAFAETGDRLTIEAAERDVLTVSGPFAASLGATETVDNLVMRALRLARDVAHDVGVSIGPVAVHLEKRLPVASGVGGGSADAAAMIAVLMARWPELRARFRQASVALGADVPMCIAGVPTLAEGIGEVLSPLDGFARIPCVLVHCGIPVSTPEVFRGLLSRDNACLPPVPPGGWSSPGDLFAYLGTTRNDLEASSGAIVPDIGRARSALLHAGASFARMSGSGATVFGLFIDNEAAASAAQWLSKHHPGWWVHLTGLAAAERPWSVG